VHCSLRVEKFYQHGLDAGPLELLFLRPRGCLTNPFRIPSLCFGVIGKTPVVISSNNFVNFFFVCIGHRDNVLARCDLIFPLLRCQGVWNTTCTQLSRSQIIFQNLKNYSLGDHSIITPTKCTLLLLKAPDITICTLCLIFCPYMFQPACVIFRWLNASAWLKLLLITIY
jgi:hypothetical protein